MDPDRFSTLVLKRKTKVVAMNAGSPLQTSRLLNELIALHARSLSVYLSDASPWMTAKNAHAKDVLDLVAADQQLMVDRLAERVIAH